MAKLGLLPRPFVLNLREIVLLARELILLRCELLLPPRRSVGLFCADARLLLSDRRLSFAQLRLFAADRRLSEVGAPPIVESMECRSQLSIVMIDDLKSSGMMMHLVQALERGEDIGHYGRLVFAMVARHFLTEDELCAYLQQNVSEDEARALCKQVEARDYNPPRPERIMEWQQQQSFAICPDPDACNVYRDLKFPDHVYEHIQEYYGEREAGGGEREPKTAPPDPRLPPPG